MCVFLSVKRMCYVWVHSVVWCIVSVCVVLLVAYCWNECLMKLICSSAMSYLYCICANLIKLHVPTFKDRKSERSRQRFWRFSNPKNTTTTFSASDWAFQLSGKSRCLLVLIGWMLVTPSSLGCQRPEFPLRADNLLKMPNLMRVALNITNITFQTTLLCLLIFCQFSFATVMSLWVLELCRCSWRFYSQQQTKTIQFFNGDQDLNLLQSNVYSHDFCEKGWLSCICAYQSQALYCMCSVLIT